LRPLQTNSPDATRLSNASCIIARKHSSGSPPSSTALLWASSQIARRAFSDKVSLDIDVPCVATPIGDWGEWGYRSWLEVIETVAPGAERDRSGALQEAGDVIEIVRPRGPGKIGTSSKIGGIVVICQMFSLFQDLTEFLTGLDIGKIAVR
jgi:hypothetical protein